MMSSVRFGDTRLSQLQAAIQNSPTGYVTVKVDPFRYKEKRVPYSSNPVVDFFHETFSANQKIERIPVSRTFDVSQVFSIEPSKKFGIQAFVLVEDDIYQIGDGGLHYLLAETRTEQALVDPVIKELDIVG